MDPHDYQAKDLLRITTAGSVDDGKSTLIGRLLYDTKSIHDDQLDQVESASRRRGENSIDLALLTDGLRAEREQKITIDVAYRYFSTRRRKFIIADTPGHLQYTRNMVTGASTADLAVILVDVTKGVQTQARRHMFISSLLGISHLIVAINKMDLAGYAQDAYDAVVGDITRFVGKLAIKDMAFVPISARDGDNVVSPSANMPWYDGGPLLHRLETVQVGARLNAIDFRFPVQYVIRPNQHFRGYAGTVASGTVRPGDEIMVLPSRRTTRVKGVETADGALSEARAGNAVVVTTTDDVDIARGDMIVRPRNIPTPASSIEAYLCWMSDEPLSYEHPYILMHTTRQVRAYVKHIDYRVNIDTMHREPAVTLSMNDIARVELECAEPIFIDSYRIAPTTGSFVLVDPQSNTTIAAGMIRGEANERPCPMPKPGPDITWEGWNIPRQEREAAAGHQAALVWLTGLPGASVTAFS